MKTRALSSLIALAFLCTAQSAHAYMSPREVFPHIVEATAQNADTVDAMAPTSTTKTPLPSSNPEVDQIFSEQAEKVRTGDHLKHAPMSQPTNTDSQVNTDELKPIAAVGEGDSTSVFGSIMEAIGNVFSSIFWFLK
jgi:hypothetical protein